MIVSMTGFGRARAEAEEGTFSVEISSVNARGQEVQVRLPRELTSFEIEFHQRIRSAYRRGRVVLRVEALFRPELSVATVDRRVLKAYHDQIETLRNELRLVEEIRIDSLLSLPGVLVPPAGEGWADRLGPTLRGLLDEGLKAWDGMRRVEGRNLEEDLRRNLGSFRGRIEAIRGRLPEALAANGEALRRRLSELLSGQGGLPDEGRLAQEIALMADRADVSEESARIDSHLGQFEAALAEPGGQGRKLDFLVQELNREVNTLDAKTPDASVRALAVEAKADLERIREQVQNAE
jgi:uncharacterized protein (TIGR00255 family)